MTSLFELLKLEKIFPKKKKIVTSLQNSRINKGISQASPSFLPEPHPKPGTQRERCNH
jgi:hypothetical protein